MPFRATDAANWSSIIRIGAKMVVIRRRIARRAVSSHTQAGWEGSIWGIPVNRLAASEVLDAGLFAMLADAEAGVQAVDAVADEPGID